MDIRALAEAIQAETEKVIVGKSDKIKLLITAVLAGGHVLLDDLPGVGKTTLARTISIALGCDYGRIQFVPDLLPSDIIGMQIYNRKTDEFEIRRGPVMTNILLADEINRAIPRTQAALLEAMEENQVSIDGESIALPQPFVVLATQNPVEMESTFRLPAAQMDRFMIRTSMGYPTPDEERRMLRVTGDAIPYAEVKAVADADTILAARRETAAVEVSDTVADYIVAITDATRNDPRLKMGASPRASKALFKASKALAAINGRSFVTPDDVKALVHPVLEHRLVPAASGRFGGESPAAILDGIMAGIDPTVGAEKTVLK